MIYRLGKQVILMAVMAVGCLLMWTVMRPYTQGRTDTFFLEARWEQIEWRYYGWVFYAHIFPAFLVLCAGLFQFSGVVRRRALWMHRAMGSIYVHAVLWCSAPAALVMVWYARGGWFTQLAFASQAVCWWLFTYTGWLAAKRQDMRGHSAWMIRSYALAFAAVTLRGIQYMMAVYSTLPSLDSYRLAAWPSWLLNLAVAELIMSLSFQHSD